MELHTHTMGKETQTRVTPPNRGQGQRGKDTVKSYQCWQCGEVGHLRRECPALKEKGLSPMGNVGAAQRE